MLTRLAITFSRRAPLALLVLLTACGSDDQVVEPETSPAAGAGPQGFYAGVFPCDGCPGINAELYLHDNGYFFGRQEFLSGSEGRLSVANTIGRWYWFADDDLLVLQARGPERRFRMPEPSVLEMIAFAEGDHRLAEAERPTDFPGRIALSGTLENQPGATIFRECLTGLATPVQTGVEYSQYQRQLRRAGSPGGALYAEFDGEYIWSAEGDPQSLAILKFGTIRPNQSC